MEMERRDCRVQPEASSQPGNGMSPKQKAKSFKITKQEVWQAWLKVRANKGAAGVDGESLEEFEQGLSRNLYKLWNRMSSGSYYPRAVKRVEIPKKDGTKRPLGIPTVTDRIAQEVARARLEPELEKIFHEDSYGYRPGKSALEAIRVCRERNWRFNWVLEVDIAKFFDTIDHELMLKAVRKHCSERWMLLYIERWLKAPILHEDGRQEVSEKGTPQGGVISPLLANLYLHYAFDEWMKREYRWLKFERYADDLVAHCGTLTQAQELKAALGKRMEECKLKLHEQKTRIVYCKDSRRKGSYDNISYTFLGYTFRPRRVRYRDGRLATSFLPAASMEAKKHLGMKLKELKLAQKTYLTVTAVSKLMNPIVRGWLDYFRQYYKSSLAIVMFQINCRLLRWVKKKHKCRAKKALSLLDRIRQQHPTLFVHWVPL